MEKTPLFHFCPFYRQECHPRDVKRFSAWRLPLLFWPQTPKRGARRKWVGRTRGWGKVWAWGLDQRIQLPKLTQFPIPIPPQAWMARGKEYLDLPGSACSSPSRVRRTRRRNMAPLSWSQAGVVTAVEAFRKVEAQLAQDR